MNHKEEHNSPIINRLLRSSDKAEAVRIEKRMMLAAYIDDAIKAKCWKKKDLAKALNKRASEITRWLSGTHNFTSDTLFDIERVLDMNLVNNSAKL